VLNLNQAVRVRGGHHPDLRGGVGTRYDQFLLRGFMVPTFLDGLKLQDSLTGYAVAQTDTSRLDRLEILKGPASAFVWSVQPGRTGRALQQAAPPPCAPMAAWPRRAACSIFIAWMPMSAATRRMTASSATGSTAPSTASIPSRQNGQPAFLDQPLLHLRRRRADDADAPGHYQHDPENGTYGGVPLVGSLRRASFGYLPRDFYDGDTSHEKFNRRQGAITYIFNHQFNRTGASRPVAATTIS
jgi:iron complex outermembrane receptor protein